MPAIEKATYAHGHKRRKAYHAVGLLGRGAEAEVRLAQSLETGEFVALKVMAKPDARTPGKRPPGVFFGLKRNGEAGGGKQICSKAEAEMRKRFAALQPLSLVHPRLPTLFEFFESERKWYVAMERCGTDLAHYVEARGGILPENDVAFVVTMLLDLLVILHAHGIVHRDIKPANVLLRETQRLDSLCLADSSNCHVDIRLATEKMGKVSQGEKPANDGPGPELRGIFPSPLSKPTSIDDTGKITPSPMDREAVWSGTTFAASSDFTSEDDDNRMDPMTTVTGTPLFLPPEVVQGIPYTSKCDIWALGCVAYQLLFGRTPFQDAKSFSELYERILSGSVSWPRGASAQAQDFIQRLLDVDPSRRPSASEAMSHPWLSDWRSIVRTQGRGSLSPKGELNGAGVYWDNTSRSLKLVRGGSSDDLEGYDMN